ncbi:hypothetical protein D1007_33321 [Hordeum vulgare]|nr:hypothetical protein D1007_33321 [Hordeum vulgare]
MSWPFRSRHTTPQGRTPVVDALRTPPHCALVRRLLTNGRPAPAMSREGERIPAAAPAGQVSPGDASCDDEDEGGARKDRRRRLGSSLVRLEAFIVTIQKLMGSLSHDKRPTSKESWFLEYICPRNANEDEEELMRMAADDVDDTNDNELICLYDKENPVIEVGKLWPSMVEFRMSFRTFAVKKEFEAKTMWTDRKKFYARSKGFDGGGNACKWRKRAEKGPPLVVEQCWPVKKARLNGFRRKRTITAEHELTETVSAEHEQTETVTAEHELTETVTESFLHALGQSETVADEAVTESALTCLEVVLPRVEHEKTKTVTESALTAVLPYLEVVLPCVEL